MAEALVAFGIATNIVQFIDFTSKVISKTYQIGKWKYGGLSGSELIETVNNDLRTTLINLEKSVLSQQANNGTQPVSPNQQELLNLADQCKEVADQLFIALKSLKSSGNNAEGKNKKVRGHRQWDNFRTALKTVWKDDKIKELESRVDAFRQQLIMRILVSFRDQMRDSRATQDLIEKHMTHIDNSTEGLGQCFLAYVEESRRWQTDLIDAIHRDDTTAQKCGSAASVHETGGRVSKLQQDILDRLYFAEMKDRENRIIEAHEKTFRWIYKPDDTPWPSFPNWLKSGSGLYWITGKAGSGKSTLMKYIHNNPRTLESLQVWSGSTPLVTAAFFLWNSGANLQMSQMGLLRSVLHQILLKNPQLIPLLLPKRWEAYSLFGNDPHPWSVEELRRAFGLLAVENPTNTNFCFFIDGLDEFDGDHSELNQLFKEVTYSENVKICVSSRPWVVFEDAFGGSFCLMLHDLTKRDIQTYVRSNFERSTGFVELQEREPKYSAELQDHVAEKADGVFLWVHLVVRSLVAGLQNGDRVIDLENRLKQLPPNLEDLYDNMLNSLDPFYYSHASQYFQLANAASKPPTILALSYADEEPNYAFDCRVRSLTDDERLSRATTMRRRLNSRCKGLLEIATSVPIYTAGPRSMNDSALSNTFHSDSFPAGLDPTVTLQKFPADDRQVLVHQISVADSTVQYLHRTVKDYVERPIVWERLLELGPENYNPRLALCRAYVAQFKQMDPNTLNWETFWSAVRLCMEYASVDSDPTREFTNLLDELDRAASTLASFPCRDGSTFVSCYSRFLGLNNSGLYPHWSCTWSGCGPNRGLSFLSLAVKLNLYYYVEAKAGKNCLVMQHSGLWPLLMDAITYDQSFNSFFDIKDFPSLRMVTLLLNKGANPNVALPKGTVFEWLLQEAREIRTTKNREDRYTDDTSAFNEHQLHKLKLMETHDLGIRATCKSSPGPLWIETIYEFLTHGADPTVDLESHLGLSFFGAVRTKTQVISNRGLMKSWFGIGNNVQVFKRP